MFFVIFSQSLQQIWRSVPVLGHYRVPLDLPKPIVTCPYRRFYVILDTKSAVHQGRPEICGRPGSLIIWRPLKPIFFKLFGLRQTWGTFWRARVRSANTFWRNTFARENLRLLAPYFPLFQIRYSAPYRLAPAVSCPAGQLFRSALVVK